MAIKLEQFLPTNFDIKQIEIIQSTAQQLASQLFAAYPNGVEIKYGDLKHYAAPSLQHFTMTIENLLKLAHQIQTWRPLKAPKQHIKRPST